MSKIRKDLVGTVHAINQGRDRVILKAGDKIPDGYFVGGHVVEGGDPSNQTPPWGSTSSPMASGTVKAPAPAQLSLEDVLDGLIEDGVEAEEIISRVASHLDFDLSGSQETPETPSGTDAPETPETPAAGPTSSEDAGSPVIPAKVGTGSSTEAWREYAIEATKRAGLKLDIADDAKRGDIIDALEAAKIATA